MTRDQAIEIARACAKAKPQSYYAEPFQPHEWVIDAIMQAHTLPPLDDDQRGILGRPNFACRGIADALRARGHEIERRAEAEQAAALHWMLGLYLKHGGAWFEHANAYLQEPNDG